MTVIDPQVRGRFELTLLDGRKVQMVRLLQWQAYEGLLEGHPGPRVNELTVRFAKDSVEEQFKTDYPVTVISPALSLFEFPELGADDFESCEVLPAIACGAIFDSSPTSKGMDEDNSSAVIVWFQDEWGPPTPSICDQIANLNWDEVAGDWSY